jgi:hypothetical protein
MQSVVDLFPECASFCDSTGGHKANTSAADSDFFAGEFPK